MTHSKRKKEKKKNRKKFTDKFIIQVLLAIEAGCRVGSGMDSTGEEVPHDWTTAHQILSSATPRQTTRKRISLLPTLHPYPSKGRSGRRPSGWERRQQR